MKIYQKFITAFSLVALIIGFLGLITVQTFQQINGHVTALSMLETTGSTTILAVELNEFFVTNEPKHLEEAKQAIAKMQGNVEQHTAHESHIGEEEHKDARDMENRAKDIINLAEHAFKLQKEANHTEVEKLQRQIHIKVEALYRCFSWTCCYS